MAKNNNAVDETASATKPFAANKTLKVVGIIAGGMLALGGTFAAGAAFGHSSDRPFGGDFAAGDHRGPGEFGHGDGDRDHGEFGDRDDDGGPQGGFQAPNPGGPAAPSAPAPTTTP